MSKNKIAVIPTYNEEENINALLDAIFKIDQDLHVLFIDDSSKDKTASLIRNSIYGFGSKIFLLIRPKKLGLGTAYITGFSWALEHNYEIIIGMDADLSHDPSYIPLLIEGLQTNDGVIGSRYISGGKIKNWGFLRHALSRLASAYARIALGVSIKDLTAGFSAWRASALKRINLTAIQSEGYTFQIELKYRALKKGLRLQEIPIVFTERRAGTSKISGKIIFEAIWRTPWLRNKNFS